MSKQTNKPVALAIGAALVGGLALSSSAFAMTDLATGYMLGGEQAAKAGEGKCGMDMDANKDGKVSQAEFTAAHKGEESKFTILDANKDGSIDATEMKTHKARMEGKCGEGKCGEGKCGGEEKKGDMEGKCGEGKCGGMA
ncbi:MAG TPA: hypothetical protein VIT66_12105 [Lysobacter sp.]